MKRRSGTRKLLVALAAGLIMTCLAAGTYLADGDLIGILMPTKEQTTWSNQARLLEEQFAAAGFTTSTEYAEDDSAKQVMQIENMITKGAKALVIAAVDCAALTDACEKAKEAGCVIVADDRLITNTEAVDYYVTFDLVTLGEMQGQYVVDALGLEENDGPFNMEIFSGSQDDTNSIMFYTGEMNILQPYIDSGKLVVKSGQAGYTESAIQSWDSSKAQNRMDNLLSGYYADEPVDAVVCAADCLAIGVVSSLDSMGYTVGENWPVVTGQDAELACVKNILEGKQAMTVFLDDETRVGIIVPLVADLLEGKEVEPDLTYNNEVFEVPTKTYAPTVIDKDNVDFLIEAGMYTEEEIHG